MQAEWLHNRKASGIRLEHKRAKHEFKKRFGKENVFRLDVSVFLYVRLRQDIWYGFRVRPFVRQL